MADDTHYVVWSGSMPGIYSSWEECQKSVLGFKGAYFNKFNTKAEAISALEKKEKKRPKKQYNEVALCVDGSCLCGKRQGEIRGVLLPDCKEVFRAGPWKNATNNLMEYLAIIHGLKWMIESKTPPMIIYSDSSVALKWVTIPKGWTNTTSKIDEKSELGLELNAATKWIEENAQAKDYLELLCKWDTKTKGEIPADFNRK